MGTGLSFATPIHFEQIRLVRLKMYGEEQRDSKTLTLASLGKGACHLKLE